MERREALAVWFVVGGLAVLGVGIMLAIQPRNPVGSRVPTMQLAGDALHVTKGSVLPGGVVNVPTFRAVAPGTTGNAMAVVFVSLGGSLVQRALASGQERRQIGIKLRAANGCNLIYVMWRLDPVPELEVSIKMNPGKHVHAECGIGGYTKVHPTTHTTIPEIVAGQTHSLHAEVVGTELFAWIDGRLVWQGALPQGAMELAGPSGIRSDNLSYRIVSLRAPIGKPFRVNADDED